MRSFFALSYLPLVALSQFLDYDKFNSYADIDFWLRQLGADVFGLTHEGRNLRAYEKTNFSNEKVRTKGANDIRFEIFCFILFSKFFSSSRFNAEPREMTSSVSHPVSS